MRRRDFLTVLSGVAANGPYRTAWSFSRARIALPTSSVAARRHYDIARIAPRMYDMAVQGIGEPRGRVSKGDTALTDQEHLSGRSQEVPAGVALGHVASVEVEPCAGLANRLIAAP